MKRLSVAVWLCLFSFLTVGFSACGGGSSAQPIKVSLVSNPTGIDQAQTASVTATVSNDSAAAGVQWTLSGAGALSNQTSTTVTYTAPASVTSAFTPTITATSVTDSTKAASVVLKVNPLPAITTVSLAAATAGTAYNATLSASGGTTPFKWTITSGALPPGLTLSSSSGLIAGIPTGGNGSATFQLADAAGNTATQTLSITVNPPPALTITTASLPGGAIGTTYNQSLVATGGVPSYSWSVTAGSLPAGLLLSTSGVISGTPTGPAGTSNFTVKVTDSETPTAATKTANLSIVVTVAPLNITTTSLAGGSLGTAYSQTVLATGGTPPYTWSLLAGSLPAGLSLNANTGTISGVPTATGTASFTIKVTDSATATATASLSITINAALAITTTSLPSGSVGTAYSASLTATGGAVPYTWSVTAGTLPAGLSLNSGTGVISGTSTTTGTSNFTVTVTDSESPAVTTSSALSIAISSASCPNNGTLSGQYAMLLNGWSASATVTAAIGSFTADGGGTISSGIVDLNDQSNGPLSGTFTGTYCVSSNNLATITLHYGGGLSGTNTFAAALNSAGSNGNIIFYDNTILKASGLLRKQDSTAFSTGKIKGNYAFGFVGAGGSVSAPRFAMAGQFNSNGTGALSGEFDSDIYLLGPANATLSSSNFTVGSNGRGTATITFTGQNNLQFVFYVVSASEMLAMEDDVAGSSLLAGQVLQQSASSFTDTSLNGTGVIELESLKTATTAVATAGLVTANGSGTINWSADQNSGGAMSTVNPSGTYSTSSDGRVTQLLGGVSSPQVFYLVGTNQAFVVGTDSLTVDFGVMVPQVGSSFNLSSLNGAYQGGSMQPVSAIVGERVASALSNGAGSFNQTSDDNSISGPTTNSLTATTTVSSNGRGVVSSGGSQVGIVCIVSPTQFVFLPASAIDTQPKLVQFQK